jgi:hypothetical protein
LLKIVNDNAQVVLHADDTSLIITSLNPTNFTNSANKILQDINKRFTTNLLSLNPDKTQHMQFVTKTSSLIDLQIMYKNKKITNTCNIKFLGLTLDNTFSWKNHTHTIIPTLSSACFAVRAVKPFVAQESLKTVYFSYLHSIMTYVLVFWGNSYHTNTVFKLQKGIIRIMAGVRNRVLQRIFQKIQNVTITVSI